MHLLVSIIDWEYPPTKEEIQPTVWNMQDQNHVMGIVLSYGNGVILELRAEGENEEAIEFLRRIALSTGQSIKIELSSEEKQNLWLYHEGDECYRQPMREGGYTFINPEPQPKKFAEST
ncbi:MAG: hypothetical protein KJ069_14335 [Anaerolineae bacterium]|nr:hypothetical protein [Anaerolineae bacterium]